MDEKEMIFTQFLQISPVEAMSLPPGELISILEGIYGNEWNLAINPSNDIASPVCFENSTAWIRRARCVGINVRTIDHFWNIIPYALTLPKSQNAVHILPIWEPGVVGSLYAAS
jgi:hypothetical protein